MNKGGGTRTRWTILDRTLDPSEVDERRKTDCKRYDTCLDEVEEHLGRKPEYSFACDDCKDYKPKTLEELRAEARRLATSLAAQRS